MWRPPPSRGRLLRFEPDVNAHQDKSRSPATPTANPSRVATNGSSRSRYARTADATLRSRPIEMRSRPCRSRGTAATAVSVGIAEGRYAICERRGLDRSIPCFPMFVPKGQALHRLFRRVRETGAATARSRGHRAVKRTEEITDVLLGGGARFGTLRRCRRRRGYIADGRSGADQPVFRRRLLSARSNQDPHVHWAPGAPGGWRAPSLPSAGKTRQSGNPAPRLLAATHREVSR